MSRHRNTLIVVTFVIIALAVGAYFYKNHQADAARVALQAEQILEEGVGLYGQDRFREAIQVLSTIPKDAPADWRVPYYTGMAQLQLRNFEAAAGSLEASVELDSTQIAPLFALGVTYFKLGNLGMSKSYFAAVLEIDPGNEEARGMMNTMAGLERVQPNDSPDG